MSNGSEPTVVVIGGGYGGIAAVKALDDMASVVLVEPKEAFFHNVAALRGLVDPDWLTKIFIPYDGLLKRGRVVRDRAKTVDGSTVTLSSGDTIDADYVVLATGSSYPFPAKSFADRTLDAHGHYRAAHRSLQQAERVLLLGAGPVGIELAGEIHAIWPEKGVTIVDLADDVLGERFSVDLRTEIRRQLGELGVEVLLGSPLRERPPTAPGQVDPFEVSTLGGTRVSADIWFQCFGVTPISDYLVCPLAAARTPDGFVEVTEHLQVVGHETVFAVGDISTADAKMAGAASRQAAVVVANIKALIAGEGRLTAYQSSGPAIAVPIGPEGGAGQFPGQDGVIGPEVVADLKGRDMMVDRFVEMLGATR